MNTSSLLRRYRTELDNETGYVPTERALLLLLEKHEEEITGLIEADPSGLWFHKAFRQIDVIDGQTDMAIWHLIHTNEIWWKIIKEEQEKGDNEMTTLNAKSDET